VRENEISLRKWSGGTAHAQMVRWYCACAPQKEHARVTVLKRCPKRDPALT